MKLKTSNVWMLSTLVVGAAISRLLPHPWNWTPVAAMALFSGARFSSRVMAYVVPTLAMIVSDCFLGFHATLPFVYVSFWLIVFLGTRVADTKKGLHLAGASLAGSVLFFVVTNLGHFLMTSMYPKSVVGLMSCFTAAVPFFRQTLLGDLFYNALFFSLHYAITTVVLRARPSSHQFSS